MIYFIFNFIIRPFTNVLYFVFYRTSTDGKKIRKIVIHTNDLIKYCSIKTDDNEYGFFSSTGFNGHLLSHKRSSVGDIGC